MGSPDRNLEFQKHIQALLPDPWDLHSFLCSEYCHSLHLLQMTKLGPERGVSDLPK